MLRNVPAVLAVLALALAIGGCSAKSPKPAKQTYVNIDQVFAVYDANGELLGQMKGDVLAAQGKRPDARAAYKSALEKSADKAGAGRELLQQKLDSLGEAA